MYFITFFHYILYTIFSLIDTHKLFVRTAIQFNATNGGKPIGISSWLVRIHRGNLFSNVEQPHWPTFECSATGRPSQLREATAVAILWPSSDISVSCPQAFLACGRVWVYCVFCHLRSRVFANERPTVPSIFNVYGDSGECPSAISCLPK